MEKDPSEGPQCIRLDSFVLSCFCVFVSALLLLIILESSLANSPLKIMVEIKPLGF
jgi:hypothetical protein